MPIVANESSSISGSIESETPFRANISSLSPKSIRVDQSVLSQGFTSTLDAVAGLNQPKAQIVKTK
jgi:hypothetical protein